MRPAITTGGWGPIPRTSRARRRCTRGSRQSSWRDSTRERRVPGRTPRGRSAWFRARWPTRSPGHSPRSRVSTPPSARFGATATPRRRCGSSASDWPRARRFSPVCGGRHGRGARRNALRTALARGGAMSSSDAARYAPRAVTHEELHALLPEYAAGTLDVEASQAVRAHLAGGCLECLNDVFVRPVGLPRSAGPPPAPAPRAAPPEPRARRGRALEAAVVVLAVAVAAGVAWTIAELRGREAAYRAQATAAASQLAETDAVRRDLAARVPALERDAESARAEAARQAAAIRETAEASARVQNELDAAHERIETLLR